MTAPVSESGTPPADNRSSAPLAGAASSAPPAEAGSSAPAAEPGSSAPAAEPRSSAPRRRPTPAEVAAARGRTIPDLVAPGLRVLFAGINPSLYSAATGYHFARPGNRFWPALHQSRFTPRLVQPENQVVLLDLGLGITNVVARATARADELDAAELRSGGQELAALAARLDVTWLAVLGVTAYRAAFRRPDAHVGPQAESFAGTRVWILPNPSGLNAHWSAAALAAAFGELRETVEASTRGVR